MRGNGLKIGVAVVLLIVAGVMLYEQFRTPAPARIVRQAWYYDLNTCRLFAANVEGPPIDAPSGPLVDGKPAGVRAYVFACGDCATESDRVVAWLETFTVKPNSPGWDAAGRRRPAAPPSPQAMRTPVAAAGPLVKRPGDDDWAQSGSTEGKTRQAVPECPNGATPKPCTP